jgi:hypothetical protein
MILEYGHIFDYLIKILNFYDIADLSKKFV